MTGKLVPLAKVPRKSTNETERLLWRHLRAKHLGRLKFRRQQPIGKYIVDFACFEKKIVIELDGGQHADNATQDKIRDDFLKSEGFRVLRIWNNELFENVDGVLETIMNECDISPSPQPSPAKGRGGIDYLIL